MSNSTKIRLDPVLATFRSGLYNRIEADMMIAAKCQGGHPIFHDGTVLFARLYDGPGAYVQELVLREASGAIYVPIMDTAPSLSEDLMPTISSARKTYNLSPHFATMSLSFQSVLEFGLTRHLPLWAELDSSECYHFAALRYELDQQPKENQ